MNHLTRIAVIEQAAAELLESETNASLRIGVRGTACDGLVLTAAGCSLVVGLEHRGAVLLSVSALAGSGGGGPRALAAGCERVLRTVHALADDFIPTVSFDDPVNAARFRRRRC
jgi:hypothetical protein